uniref:Zinc/iron transporter n=1 Tax=Graphocephala atropunctata TaxID=36148 RepID=A0A1B6KG26_9HEMI
MLAGVGVKAAAAITLSAGSYITGTLPSCLGLDKCCKHSLCLSLTLCFGGGVLLATSVVHVLTDARLILPKWADFVFCLGFMMLYMIDELIKLCESHDKKVHCHLEVEGLLDRTVHHRYESIAGHEENGQEEEPVGQDKSEQVSVKIKPLASNRIGLLIAFSVHSIIEGLVIGVQPVPAKLFLLLGAISSHKLVISFCLGAELASDGRSFFSLSQSMLVYSLGSSLGIVLGILIEKWQTTSTDVSIPVLQALAAGSLLYVTVSEVLPRERSRWEHQTVHPLAGLAQFILFSLGFSVISVLVFFT